MTFISFNYALFLLIVLGIYWSMPRQSWRVFILLVASLIFYATIQPQYIPLLLIISLFNFYLAQAIGEPKDWRIANKQWNRRRLLLLWLGIISNILLLLSFKYIPFLLNSIGILYNIPNILETANWVDSNVIAPLGLSFFCFECLAYLIDVYRGAPSASSLLEFTSYKLFFPKLISGPITRYHYLQNQLGMIGKKNTQALVKTPAIKLPTLEQITEGIWLIATGAVKKALIADNLGIFVELSFSNLQRAGSGDLWLATVAYGLQLYLDFTAYVDIARGSAFLMGLNLPQNFDFPYFSTSIAAFWRRWHTTLGDWLRNYLYFPLGGSRVGLFRTCLNLLIVMLIAGIWHGAAWGFIVWGVLHGLALVIHRLVEAISQQFKVQKIWESLPGILISWLLTQSMVFGAWIFFRLPNLRDSIWVIDHWWSYDGDVQFVDKVYLEAMGLERLQLVWLIFGVVVLMAVNYWFHRGLKLQLNWQLKVLLVPLFFFVVWLLAPEGLPYIYFDF
ncbi:MAG: MBOAT family protein [Okeania sp. SIO2F4]|uniref:MBOAT family O-acyltransferase n=1 Tax=Okeania sp. SIO2F4 TaxID=2607790 RepID=UPI00142BC2C6|nr:MBOAT family O-acyltransferase [Okeania sp. SIO2F4]NES01478.1 MBOAT family protein [Okeania sp. SIO2F4]